MEGETKTGGEALPGQDHYPGLEGVRGVFGGRRRSFFK